MISSDFDFQTRRPAEPLGCFVESVWHARGRTPHRRERILASADAVLLLVLGAPLRMVAAGDDAVVQELTGAWITGPHETPILNQPMGETHVVGAVFQPGGIGAFLDEPSDSIANRILPLSDVPSSLGAGRALLAALDPCPGAACAIERLGQELAARLSPPADHERWRRAAQALTSPDVHTVAEVQLATGVSRRHFAAQIRRRVGLLPKSLQRIARMRRLLEDLDARTPISWSSEAVGAGYFDQPHAVRGAAIRPGGFLMRLKTKFALLVMSAGLAAGPLMAVSAGPLMAASMVPVPAASAGPLDAFGALVVGEWETDDSRQVFEWGVGQQTIRSRSYFKSDGGWTLVGEGMWFWDPGREAIRGIAVAIEMPVDLFEYRSEVRNREIVHDLVAQGAAGGEFVERWVFEDGGYRWSLGADEDGKLVPIMGGTYQRVRQ